VLRRRFDKAKTDSEREELSRGVPAQNNIVFTWAGSTSTLSWTAGFVKDQKGRFLPIPAGNAVLNPSTTYWAAWNPVHQTMSFQTSLGAFKGIKNLIVICSVFTGTTAQSGTAGGGGSDPGGDSLNGRIYKFF
jgi:hypothetical protein